MSESPISPKLEDLLSAVYGDIIQHVPEERLQTAERAFYSTRDFALGDTVSCTAGAALENCEQIQSCFPRGVPKSAIENIEKVRREIQRMDQGHRPFLLGKLWLLVIIAAVAFFIYFILTHRN